jgi:hypothetical protein
MESKRNQPMGDALAPGGTSGAHQADSARTIGSARADGESNDSRSDAKYTKSLSTIAALDVTGNEALYALEAEIEYQVDRSRTEVTILRYCGSGMPLDELAAPAVTYCSDGAWKAAVRSDRTFDARGTLVWTDRSSSLETRMPAAFRGTLLDGNAIAYVSTVTDGQVKGCGAPAKAISLQVPAAW